MMEGENCVRKTEAGSAEVRIVDWDHALKRVDGSEEALQELIGIFCIEECPKLMRGIRDGLVNKDAVGVGRAAHTLKSSADLFGARRAFDAAHTLEQLAHQSDFQGAARAWETLEPELGELQAALANPKS